MSMSSTQEGLNLNSVSRQQLCGYDIQLAYPQNGTIPGVELTPPPDGSDCGIQIGSRKSTLSRLVRVASTPARRDGVSLERRNLQGRTNGSIDAMYGCCTLEML